MVGGTSLSEASAVLVSCRCKGSPSSPPLVKPSTCSPERLGFSGDLIFLKLLRACLTQVMTLAITEEVVRGTRGRTEKEDSYAFQCLARKLSVFSQSLGATALQLLTGSRCGQVRAPLACPHVC